uniref:hsp70-binding protein 1-like isoform X2 n=1 Tax=Myxine glutinosa TaxID=7769 RepID=UPI00358FDF76
MADRENVSDNSQVNLQVQVHPQQQVQVHLEPQQQLQMQPQLQMQIQVQPQQQIQMQPQLRMQPQQQIQVQPQLQMQPQQQIQVQPQQQIQVQPQQQLQVKPQQQLQVQPQQQLQVQPQQQLQMQPQQQIQVQPQQQIQVQPQQQIQVQPQQQIQVQPQQQIQVHPQQQLQVHPQQQLQVQPQQQIQVQPQQQIQVQPVRDLPGLLRAVTSIRGAAGTTNTEHSAMSAENQQWLMNAFGELCCPSDDVQLMKQAISLLEVEPNGKKEEGSSREKNEEEEEWDKRVQRQERALDTLLEITEIVDYSRDFCKLGGMDVVFTGPLLSSAPSLRHRAAELVATCAQNEPTVQSCVLSLGGLQTLLDLVDKDIDEVVRLKALLAVSCIVRESEAALHEFVEKDGCSLLLRSLQNESPRLRAKTVFLVHCLLRNRPHLQENFIAMGTVQQLGMMLQDFHEPSHEHIAGALCCLASHPMGLAGCQEPDLGLEQALCSRISELGTNDQFQEEKEFCEQLLEIFAANGPSNGAMDR